MHSPSIGICPHANRAGRPPGVIEVAPIDESPAGEVSTAAHKIREEQAGKARSPADGRVLEAELLRVGRRRRAATFGSSRIDSRRQRWLNEHWRTRRSPASKGPYQWQGFFALVVLRDSFPYLFLG